MARTGRTGRRAVIALTVLMLALQPVAVSAAWAVSLARASDEASFLLALRDAICGSQTLEAEDLDGQLPRQSLPSKFGVCDWCPGFGGPPALLGPDGAVVLDRVGASNVHYACRRHVSGTTVFTAFHSRAPPTFADAF